MPITGMQSLLSTLRAVHAMTGELTLARGYKIGRSQVQDAIIRTAPEGMQEIWESANMHQQYE